MRYEVSKRQESSIVETIVRDCLFTLFLPGENWQQPVLLLVSKHLSDILPETQREAVLIRACPEDWCSERL